jgi:hypothetical protein
MWVAPAHLGGVGAAPVMLVSAQRSPVAVMWGAAGRAWGPGRPSRTGARLCSGVVEGGEGGTGAVQGTVRDAKPLERWAASASS